MANEETTMKGSNEDQTDNLLPVSLLCGFLGAGKTTLMKHILETKHAEEDFKCAIIVNDMAALNIDKSLIDQSALVQSDEVIAMQNGCFCCTLQSDLVDQIISLTKKNIFNYMLIEASGVSEPSQIAPLFDLCDDEHDPDDPEHDHQGPQLGEVARLDTCVTVVDSAEFYNNLGSMKTYEQGETMGTIAELMMEQVEYSNVVVLNKGDLVTEEQQVDIIDKISVLNPKAKIVQSIQSRVNVMDILNTRLYKADKGKEEFWITASKEIEEKIEVEMLQCCERSVAKDGRKCCRAENKDGKVLDTGISQVYLGVLPAEGTSRLTRHEARFGITSFIYRARRPFHPGRLHEMLLEPYFMLSFLEDEEDEDEEDKDKEQEEEMDQDKKEEMEAAKLEKLQQAQRKAAGKQKVRAEAFGDLLRSKGFIWIASTNNIIGGWQQAGNIIRLEAESPWMCEMREMWEGTPSEELVNKDLKQSNGEDWPFGDRRQELVFIGQSLKHSVLQTILDQCLLNDDEMKMGPEKWEETMASEDKIQLSLDEGDEEEGEDGEEGEEGDEEGKEGENDSEADESEDVTPPKRMK